MLFCVRCGSKITDGQNICPVCGAYVETEQQSGGYGQNTYQQNVQTGNYGQDSYQQSIYQQNSQVVYYGQNAYQQNAYQQNAYQQNIRPGGYGQNLNQQNSYHQNMQYTNYGNQQLGMNWFKFIIYFQLFVTAITGVVNGFRIMTGLHYGLDSVEVEIVYLFYSGLKTLDIVTGIMLILIGIFAIFTRFMLAGYKKSGPPMYLGLQIANILISIVYIIAFYSILDSIEDINSSTFVSLIVSIVLLIINVIYFNKRKHLFVN